MVLLYILVSGFVVVFGISAVAALVWAVRNGQMQDFGRGAMSIFDSDEPVGVVTDSFPGDEPGSGRGGA